MKSKVELKFSKSHHATGVGIVNSMQSYHYSVDRPDSILFRAFVFDNYKVSSKIDARISTLPQKYRMPMDYSHDSGKHAVPAKHAVVFLDFLVALTMEHADLLYINKNELTALLSSLVENEHITSKQASDYSERIPVVYDINDMERDAETNRDADLALRLAQLYKQKRETSSQLYWLNQAKHFNSSHSFFATAENIMASLEGIKSADIRSLFQEGDSANWLLDAVATCPTFKCLDFGTFFYPRCINQTFVDFLAKSSSVSELHMGSVWSADSAMRMNSKHAQVLANALHLNKSVELLDVSDQRIGDEGLTAIVNALIANSETKLKSLNIFCCGITERGAAYLLENIDRIPSLRFVNLRYNRACSEATVNAIDALLDARKATESISAPITEEIDRGTDVAASAVTEAVAEVASTVVVPNASSNVANMGMFSSSAPRTDGNIAIASQKDTKSESRCCIM